MYGRPGAVEGRPWTVWQFSSRGRVPGISTFVDENAFVGAEVRFQRMLAGR